MKEDPSEPPCRARVQTAMSCFGRKVSVVNVTVKRRDIDHVRLALGCVWISNRSQCAAAAAAVRRCMAIPSGRSDVAPTS